MHKKLFSFLMLFSLGGNAMAMSNVAVFCSADDKVSDRFKAVAYNLGVQLGKHNFGLITGGSCTGLMKEVTDGYVSSGASVQNLYGVLPVILKEYNVLHSAIAEGNVYWSQNMHERLATFHELADVVVVLPGGFGTLHECLDYMVNNQFALSKTPVILINLDGYWNNLLAQFNTMLQANSLTKKHLNALYVVASEAECLEILNSQECIAHEQGLQDKFWEKER